ncbi:MAG: DUF4384 domain-containing protein [Deltaproteobacteria bacterium]|nr:DUF4384 domain-containing protein [Deltaproteobacteria bacterium]
MNGAAANATANGLTLSYRVLSKPAAGGEYRVVKPAEQLHTDDRLVFEVMVTEQAHVFISQRPKGKPLAVLFPNAGIDITNPLPPNTWTRIPSGTKSFRLNDKDVGPETVFFVASRVPPPNLAAAIANDGKAGAKPSYAVEDQIVAVAMEKRGDCVGRGREIVLDGDDDCKVKTRGIELDDENRARRVRGMTIDDVVFVPFKFVHHLAAATTPKPQPVSPKPSNRCVVGKPHSCPEACCLSVQSILTTSSEGEGQCCSSTVHARQARCVEETRKCNAKQPDFRECVVTASKKVGCRDKLLMTCSLEVCQ